MSRIKIFDETRHTCTFRTTKKDQENLAKAMEYFETKSGKNISKNVAIILSLELVAKLNDEATRKSHSKNRNTADMHRKRTSDRKEILGHQKSYTEIGTERTEPNSNETKQIGGG